jgi:hypothetical protein
MWELVRVMVQRVLCDMKRRDYIVVETSLP